jgi:hypothetical protein
MIVGVVTELGFEDGAGLGSKNGSNKKADLSEARSVGCAGQRNECRLRTILFRLPSFGNPSAIQFLV